MPYFGQYEKKQSKKKNGDAPGSLGDFVKWLVTERTQKKRHTNKVKTKTEKT